MAVFNVLIICIYHCLSYNLVMGGWALMDLNGFGIGRLDGISFFVYITGHYSYPDHRTQ